jgi:hypothetical protein
MKLAPMKLAAMALASAFVLSGTCAFAHTVRHKSKVGTRPMYSDAAPSVVPQPKYGNPDGNFGGTGNRDVWGHWGAYYGPMIPSGAGGR